MNNTNLDWLKKLLETESEGIIQISNQFTQIRNKKIEAIVFDFDGVLLKEIGIAEKGYAWVIRAIKFGKLDQGDSDFQQKDIDYAKKIRPKIKGKNIIEKVCIIREILNIKSSTPTTEEIIRGWYGFFKTFIQNYFTDNKDNFLIPGAKNLIKESSTKCILFGLTANEHNHAQWLMRFVSLDHYFKEIVGFPSKSLPFTSKASLLADLCFRNGIDASRTCFIGDGASDINAGKKAGAITIGIANNELPICKVSNIIEKERIIEKSIINAKKLLQAKCDYLATSTLAYADILRVIYQIELKV